jgi:isopentenyldiphosphate isomerase
VVELWQLYDEQGRPLVGQGGTKDDVYGKALLHGASHVWIWRKRNGTIQVLLQKRTASKRTWPNHFDISAAGHIDLDEDPITAAVRETKEEIGFDVADNDLQFIGVDRRKIVATMGEWTENELCWLYTLRLDHEENFVLADGEVESLVWKDLSSIKDEIAHTTDKYVPHGNTYYSTVFESIEKQSDE